MTPILAPDDPLERALWILAAQAARRAGATSATIRWAMTVLIAEVGHHGLTPIEDRERCAARQRVQQMVKHARPCKNVAV